MDDSGLSDYDLSDSEVPRGSTMPDFMSFRPLCDPELKKIKGPQYLSKHEERYNEIVIAVINQAERCLTSCEVTFIGCWYNERDDMKYHTQRQKETFSFDKDRMALIVGNIHTTAHLMDKIADLGKSHTLTTKDQYMVTHDRYLRNLSEFHHAVSVQATTVLEILRDIETKTDRLKKALKLSVIDNDGNQIDIGDNPEKFFPGDPALVINEEDIEIVKMVYHMHRQLGSYITSARTEILNCLADVQDLPVEKQELSLQNLCTTMPPIEINRKKLQRISERAYLVVKRTNIKRSTGENVSSEEKNEEYGDRWCHISKMFWRKGIVKNAHIIPAATNPVLIRCAFGDPEPARILNCSRNFVFMHNTIEKAFDVGRVTIIPINLGLSNSGGSASTVEFRLLVIDRSLLYKDETFGVNVIHHKMCAWRDLAKSPQLEFKSDFRPGLRNVFWHNISSLAKAKQQSFPGYVEALQDFEEAWAGVGARSWIAKPVIEGLAIEFRIPELAKPEVYLNEAEANKLNALYALTNLPWESPHPRRTRDTDSDPEMQEPSEEYSYPFIGPLSFASPRVVRLHKDVMVDSSTDPR